ncbi:hypothetical protein [Paenibacillus harenae]|uniref:hypothetical protein n=1 Tax=Paenibacillus harenae TaxID=306543 RepID=UPI00048FA7A9|nr:hypothetical protein [Paenibacillus harenae]
MQISTAIAYRKERVITVLVMGNLPRSCDSAKIVDKYPGGNIVYVRDPGYAQVFIEFKSSPEMCPTLLTPWLSQIDIDDDEHNEVEIRINGESVYTTVVNESIEPVALI